ncbi:MAG: hypothetical protein TYPL_0300 [Candidatus Tyloplasma litorale]|nr:MAG: hypothetical protein TYPL_0300 [Mycoplasmatales bacterium]
MAKMAEVRAQKRSTLAKMVLNEINRVGQNNVICVMMDEGGKFAGNSVFASLKAYIYYKD